MSATGAPRIVAIDLARWVAIVGMMTAHLVSNLAWAGTADDVPAIAATVAMGAANGNASTLFAVLAGASMVLATRNLPTRGAVLRSIAGRAIVLLGLGVVLTALWPPVYVVLGYLGWAMLLAAPLLLAPTWVVATVGGVLWAVGGTVNAWVREWRFGPDWNVDRLDGSPLAPIADLTLTGEYPAITWVVLLAAGIVTARLLLVALATPTTEAAARTRDGHGRADARVTHRVRMLGLRLALVGALLATLGIVALRVAIGIAGDAWAWATGAMSAWGEPPYVGSGAAPSTEWWWQLADVPHTGSVADVARGVGVALAALGVLLMLVPTASRLPRILEAVRAAGAAPLTIYTAHVLLLIVVQAVGFAVVGEAVYLDPPWWVAGFGALAVHVAGSIAIGLALTRADAKGPLERMTSAVARSLALPRGDGATPAA